MTIADRADFIRANTSVMTPPLVPEVRLHLAHEAVPLWQKTEEELGGLGLPPPFWAFAWAGGQALARHVLDNPGLVRGKRVIDLAAGSGLVGIAAMKAGAASALAADIDGFSVTAIGLNAVLNDVALAVTAEDLLVAPRLRKPEEHKEAQGPSRVHVHGVPALVAKPADGPFSATC